MWALFTGIQRQSFLIRSVVYLKKYGSLTFFLSDYGCEEKYRGGARKRQLSMGSTVADPQRQGFEG